MKTVTIAGQAFDLATPYAAGHTLTDAEAKTLNQVRIENIRNNKAKAVKEAFESGDAAKIDAVRAEVQAYDNEYVFTIAGIGAPRLDPVEREARNLAKEYLKAHLAKTGRTMSKTPEGETDESWAEKVEANIVKLASSDTFLAEAKKSVDAKAKRLSKLAESVDLG